MVPRSGTRMKIKFIIQQQCGGQLQEIEESCAHAPVYIPQVQVLLHVNTD